LKKLQAIDTCFAAPVTEAYGDRWKAMQGVLFINISLP
jgi:hypothetical protein